MTAANTVTRVSSLTVTFDRIGPVPAARNPTGATTHAVVPGDTLIGISRRYGVTVAQLRAWNGSDALSAGQALRLAPTLPPLTVRIPPHTSGGKLPDSYYVDAMIAYLTHPVREYVRMSPLVPDRFTVSIDLTINGEGKVLIDGGRHGVGAITATP